MGLLGPLFLDFRTWREILYVEWMTWGYLLLFHVNCQLEIPFSKTDSRSKAEFKVAAAMSGVILTANAQAQLKNGPCASSHFQLDKQKKI